jgi:hypothetical protein
MSLTTAVAVGGDYLDFAALAASDPRGVLVVARIKDYGQPEAAQGFVGTNYPVLADFLVCSGPGVGEVHEGEKVIARAMVSTLRGTKLPNAQKGENPQVIAAPIYPPGTELPLLLKLVPGKGTVSAYAALDPAPQDRMPELLSVYRDGAGWTAPQSSPAAPVPAAPVQQVAQPLNTPVGEAAARPWAAAG